MSRSTDFKPAGAILAGGRSSRLGVASKALAPLAGKSLIRHVLDRLEPQAAPVLVSVQEHLPELAAPGLVLVEDAVQRHRGPLTGLYSATQWLADHDGGEWLLLCPCDGPFMPRDLAVRLYRGAVDESRPVSVARYQDELQPAFSLWHRELLGAMRESVMEQGRGGLKQFLGELSHAVVEWAEADLPPFFNVNTPHDLAHAAQLIDRYTAEA